MAEAMAVEQLEEPEAVDGQAEHGAVVQQSDQEIMMEQVCRQTIVTKRVKTKDGKRKKLVRLSTHIDVQVVQLPQ